jgi:protein-S-isoprenylcysteine O-methyltransferase Ste14
VAGVATLWLILMPHAEEPWLREQYGGAFAAYSATVRRYL